MGAITSHTRTILKDAAEVILMAINLDTQGNCNATSALLRDAKNPDYKWIPVVYHRLRYS